MRKIDLQRDRKGVKNMLRQELCIIGRELHFRVTTEFIIFRRELIVEEINGKEKKCKIKDSQFTLNS